MFIAMNRFKITKGFEAGFEEVWRQRDSYLHTVEGFKSFSLLKGGEFDDHTSTHPILFGSPNKLLKHGPSRKLSVKPTVRRKHPRAPTWVIRI